MSVGQEFQARAPIQDCQARVADKTVQKQCPARVSRKSALSRFFDKSQARLSDKSVQYDPFKSVVRGGPASVSDQSVQKAVSFKSVKKSVKQECRTMSHKSVLQGRPIQEFSNL